MTGAQDGGPEGGGQPRPTWSSSRLVSSPARTQRPCRGLREGGGGEGGPAGGAGVAAQPAPQQMILGRLLWAGLCQTPLPRPGGGLGPGRWGRGLGGQTLAGAVRGPSGQLGGGAWTAAPTWTPLSRLVTVTAFIEVPPQRPRRPPRRGEAGLSAPARSQQPAGGPWPSSRPWDPGRLPGVKPGHGAPCSPLMRYMKAKPKYPHQGQPSVT